VFASSGVLLIFCENLELRNQLGCEQIGANVAEPQGEVLKVAVRDENQEKAAP